MEAWPSTMFVFLLTIVVSFHSGITSEMEKDHSDGVDHTDYFPYETYGEAMMECVYLMSSQREHVLEAERELLRNYGVSEDHKARELRNLFRATEDLINQTFDGLCVRLQSELKPHERHEPISDRTFARLAHTWSEVRRYIEQRVGYADDEALLIRISNTAQREMSKTYNFMKGQIKKLRDRGY